ncbi:2-phospho-L-lactate guanylyltransferase CofC [Haloterrigena turkmenica DSM 5511]|uniref:2-phospho-L-lactate guanylyltransferase n=1 Tax=Haloterrigena turkmenica (strain ATCC 51198 / DSM 5511 / JCM 9101 / NCIMB 13204 / VKM B-1734 / 4k) TaxID=543526 RepID=COFC_HALTV|nr:2-phospho-L-lactate guanylyltransferase [Haloterrigena turkmenica]D2RWE9.1 RecName: Full=2-phospho-L-lactate guanylyltransferase; Short=LP guanylyltransferase [Haloterrigena turkmenica DSM 5511]ADB59538.1 2-phospho-L-lactate guanylyltransferase CofC [Haloterrigena turkmenica DSM 5511]
MQVVVPFAATEPKTRLADVLTPAERTAFARAMLADVLTAVVEAGHEPTVLATAPLDLETLDLEAAVRDAGSVAVDDRPLTEAVNARLPERGDGGDDGTHIDPVAVVMADLALATADALEALFSAAADVAVVPGRGAGTNALVVDHPEFRVDYHGASYLDHREIAHDVGATLETVDSFRLGTDIDEPADLVEVLVHGTETDRAPARLREFGFELERTDGRVTVARLEESRPK